MHFLPLLSTVTRIRKKTRDELGETSDTMTDTHVTHMDIQT